MSNPNKIAIRLQPTALSGRGLALLTPYFFILRLRCTLRLPTDDGGFYTIFLSFGVLVYVLLACMGVLPGGRTCACFMGRHNTIMHISQAALSSASDVHILVEFTHFINIRRAKGASQGWHIKNESGATSLALRNLIYIKELGDIIIKCLNRILK